MDYKRRRSGSGSSSSSSSSCNRQPVSRYREQTRDPTASHEPTVHRQSRSSVQAAEGVRN